MSEMNALKRCLLAVAGIATLFRQNVGVGWAGAAVPIKRAGTISVSPGDVLVKNARPLHAGLVEGSSDLIGWTPVEIRPEHVGMTMAVFTAAEVKSKKGRPTDAQENFLEQVTVAGGIAGIVRSPEDAVQLVLKYSA